jgi:hypothetical protein
VAASCHHGGVPHVTALSIAPVKGLRVVATDTVEIDAHGVRGDRAFVVREADGKVALTTRNPALLRIVPRYDQGSRSLTLALPGGGEVAGVAEPAGPPVETRLYNGRVAAGRAVGGDFAAALSEHLGRPVQLVALDPEAQGGDDSPVTLMSEASRRALGAALGAADLDGRRFRMTIAIDGVEPWAEHGWAGRELAVGAAVLRVRAPTERCVVTTRDPDEGRRDQPVLKALAALHGKRRVIFGVWLDVVRPGVVRRGDAVEL